VIDEGIQFTHPDLDANVWTNPFDPVNGVDNDGNGYVDDVHGWDFTGNNNSVYDGGKSGNKDDHGTHVTGTIGAEGNGSGVVGVNWNVTYISAKFLGTSGGTTANAIKAVDYMTNLKTRHGLNVVATSNSWGGGGYSQGLRDAISRANASQILFIAAAGNSGVNTDTSPHYPSSYDLANVISVAAISSSGGLASWSNYGLKSVDLGAPGVGIWSTTAFNKYSSYSGTSMATPHVTGAAALYASTHSGATAAQIKSAILTSVIPTSSLAGKTVTGGRLDANAATAP
jgi:subtilisin family serine protease